MAAMWGTLLSTRLQGLRLSGPEAAQGACLRVWISWKRTHSFSGRHVLTASISSTAERWQKRPRAAAGAWAVQQDSSSAADTSSPSSSTPAVAIGQVMAAQANFVRVKVDSVEGGEGPPPRTRLLCVVRGLLKKIKQSVLVGDRVRVVGIDWADGRGMVEEVLPRQSELSDPAVANVDHVVLVFAADLPPWQPAQVTRYLVSAEGAGLPVTLVVNKADVAPPEQMQQILDQVAGWGYEAVPVSVLSGEGLAQLAQRLAQCRVSVVAGPSGAGKSSIINALRLRAAGLRGSPLEAMRAEPTRGGGGGSGSGENGDSGNGGNGGGAGSSGGQLGGGWRKAGSSGRAECSGGGGAEDALLSTVAAGEGREAGSGPAPGSSAAQHSQHVQQQQQQSEKGSCQGVGEVEEEELKEGGAGQAWPSDAWPAGAGADAGAGASGPLPEALELQAVGDVSQRIGRGKHTTRNVSLLELGGGALLADTPGFNQPVLGMPAAELGEAFPEIRQRLGERRCAFANCQHLAEPGCAVREEGEWERYPFYVDLHSELAAQEEVERERAASKRRREGAVRFKSRAGGKQGAEARLESKSHRRVSRRSVKQSLQELAKGLDEQRGDEY